MDNNDIINTEHFKKVWRFFRLKGHCNQYIDKGNKIEFVRKYESIILKKEDIMKLEIPHKY